MINQEDIDGIAQKCHKILVEYKKSPITVISLLQMTDKLTNFQYNANNTLKMLWFDRSGLGSIPEEIFQLKDLETLKIANPHIIEIPPGIKSLQNPHTLILSKNKIIEVSSTVAELENLEEPILEKSRSFRPCNMDISSSSRMARIFRFPRSGSTLPVEDTQVKRRKENLGPSST